MENHWDLDEEVYGQLIVLGYNGAETVQYSQNPHSTNGSLIPTRYILRRKLNPNGVVPSSKHYTVADPSSSASARDRRHYVAYVKSKTETLIQEYQADPFTDMFQIGRSTDKPIDVTVKDTKISTDFEAEETPADQRKLPTMESAAHRDSTISRFACRILVNRTPPISPRVLAAGFDNHRNICLGEKAPKWMTENGMDGLTTNGVLVFQPQSWGELGNQPNWYEVSVRGAVFGLRSSRSAKMRGQPVVEEHNILRDGTLIDLCGVTLLFRTNEGLLKSPTAMDLEGRLADLNADRPQCPVGMNTLVIPKQRSAAIKSTEQPYIYMTCGHVQGRHGWGEQPNKLRKCPICFKDGHIVKLCMAMEPGFWVGKDTSPTHSFNPCGHMASFETVHYWSKIPFPHESTAYKPIGPACPFCICLLDTKVPYVRIIFP